MEKMLGRYLEPGENVHHLDGNRGNNDASNLQLWVKKQPSGQRVHDLYAKDLERLLQENATLKQRLAVYEAQEEGVLTYG